MEHRLHSGQRLAPGIERRAPRRQRRLVRRGRVAVKRSSKRLCGKIGGGATDYSLFAEEDESQWFNACSSNGAYKYPYGSTLSMTACNTWDSNNDASSAPRAPCRLASPPPRTIGGSTIWSATSQSGKIPARHRDSALCRLRGSSYLFDDFTTDIATCQADSSAILSLKMSDVGFRCCAP